jgi:hypothetical protein
MPEQDVPPVVFIQGIPTGLDSAVVGDKWKAVVKRRDPRNLGPLGPPVTERLLHLRDGCWLFTTQEEGDARVEGKFLTLSGAVEWLVDQGHEVPEYLRLLLPPATAEQPPIVGADTSSDPPAPAAHEKADRSPWQDGESRSPEPQPSGSRRALKEPSKDAIAAYRLNLLTGKTQTELAQVLTNQLKRPVDQGTVSRWLTQVKAWLDAGNVLPDLTVARERKPAPIDPERIDLGERQDGRAKRQRGRRNSDSDD